MTRQGRAYCYALVTVGLWSTIATACKLSLNYIKPAELVFFSSIVSCLVLLMVLIIQKKLPLLATMKWSDWFLSAKLGMLNPLLYYLVLFKAYDLLPAQQAQPLNYTWAITLSILSVPLLGHKLSRGQLLAITISYFGVLVISTNGNLFSFSMESPFGIFLALLSTIFWALYWIGNTRDSRDPVVGLLMNFICAVPMIALYLLVTQGMSIPDMRGLAGAVYIGVFEMGVAFLLWLTAMKLTENTARIANLIFVSPFLSLIFIYFILGEKIMISTLVGLFFIVAGLIIQTRAKN
ncbi:DMT family transporter [Desulfosediminicola sp.]|uniref:DMT family transporter n=1 Tax=Desulfosediminicola sp. TaxID=2886825 RepID=UPI003AF26B58